MIWSAAFSVAAAGKFTLMVTQAPMTRLASASLERRVMRRNVVFDMVGPLLIMLPLLQLPMNST